jgi:hypothetical protein
LNPNYDCNNNKDIIFIVHLVSHVIGAYTWIKGPRPKERVLKIQIPFWLSQPTLESCKNKFKYMQVSFYKSSTFVHCLLIFLCDLLIG